LCDKPLGNEKYVFAHLNDKRFDSRRENVVLAHQSCNIKMVNDIDMKLKAKDLLIRREGAGLTYTITPTAIEEISSERKVNKLLFPFTEEYLEQKINVHGHAELSETLNEICYSAQKRFGAGAEPTVRRYVGQLTCSVAPFQIVTDKRGNSMIIKRAVATDAKLAEDPVKHEEKGNTKTK
jgi:hypothetical protein